MTITKSCTFVAGGGGLWYFHTYAGSGHFMGVQNFEFQYFLGFRKIETIGYEDFVDTFWGAITKLDSI